ncbi:Lipase/lipooxygenase, PLAT/LH2 family protein [Thalictrum thalictroides]|uniref:Lipase/lipooxygenase, PLAT/LH2 family protein n=1 Tax=Thalictrum thalictroides TaxID=46969 RepID=A0A7J6X6K3_THATH|nr:Lipase/lipooxygenase, PLAT/LH2 family protein [Thalictrum thalictroides]
MIYQIHNLCSINLLIVGVERLYLRNLVSLVHGCCSAGWPHPTRLSPKYPIYSIQTGRCCNHTRKPSVVNYSKAYDFQEFQDYARPLRLLPVTEPTICTDMSVEEMSTSLKENFHSVYVVKIYTSNVFGSGLNDLNTGVLLCLIDENGDSILQRISATPLENTVEGALPYLCFQRGSVNEFIFKGPKLGRIQALWIGLESGCWRLGGVSLTVVSGCQTPSYNTEDDSRVHHNRGLQYGFEAEDIPIGEGEDMSMVELKPCNVTEVDGVDLSNLTNTDLSESVSILNREVSNQESMEEYADLKISLLLYDFMLIFAGTSIAAISTGEKAALAFLTGGAGGFLYLLLLQKSVDELPAPASIAMNKEEGNLDQLLKQLKGPVSSLALAFALAGVAVKCGSGTTPIALTPQEILVGMIGFLVCKVAVLLAAFKPMQITLKEK